MMNEQQHTSTKIQLWFIVVLLTVASVFRAYHLLQIPLMNDELSALHRLQFHSFSELVKQGIIPDGHPAFVQIVLFYYTKIFGTASWLLKLPFIAAGVVSIGLVFHYFSTQLNRTTGALVASFMVPSQFFIMHSQTARPYAFGLLFVFAAAIAWEKWVKQFSYTKLLLVVLFTVLTASTHYLAALTLAIIILIACLTQPQKFKYAFLVAAISIVLYMPQGYIFIKQLQVGGVGSWLGKPTIGFVFDFFRYASNFSLGVMLVLAVGCLLSIFFWWKNKSNKQIMYVGLIWILVFGIEFLYSILRNPILQFPSLLFAFPFCLAFCFWGFSQLKTTYIIGVGLILFAFETYALVFTRKHYQVFYQQGYAAAVHVITTKSLANASLFLNGNQQFYFDYYFNQTKYNPNYTSTRIDSLSLTSFAQLIQSQHSDTIVVGHAFDLSPAYFEVAKLYYPIVVYQQQMLFNEMLVLTRNAKNQMLDTMQNQVFTDEFWGNSTQEITQKANEPLRFVAQVNCADTTIELIIKAVDKKGNTIAEAASCYFDPKSHQRLSLLALRGTNTERVFNVQAFIYNPKKAKVQSTLVNLNTLAGNGLLYATVEAIPE